MPVVEQRQSDGASTSSSSEPAADVFGTASSSAQSTIDRIVQYDVFINHRGKDVKDTIADFIYESLRSAGVRAFLDRDEIHKGDNLSAIIREAIAKANLHIAIFSRNYAESPWCLAELCLLLESGAPIIPIFYDVEPSHLRWATRDGPFYQAFTKHAHNKRFGIHTLEMWKRALHTVSFISGWKLTEFKGQTGKLLKAVVRDVLRRVNSVAALEVAKYPVGLSEKMEKLQGLLESRGERHETARVLGIVGMGGLGKTTLAKEMFNKTRSHFKTACFLHDIKEKIARHGLEVVQSMILQDLLHFNCQIRSFSQGKQILKDRLLGAHVFIILDNIDDSEHLDALMVAESLHPNSLILITTRNKRLIESLNNSVMYEMDGLDDKSAKQLFCWHAFLRPHPALEFDDLVERFVKQCNGLPLSLEVLGGQLYGITDAFYWECTLEKISNILPDKIKERLRISYDGLDPFEKQIFFDIACFFVGEEKDTGIRIWDASGWSGWLTLQTLRQKCLVEVDEECTRMLMPSLEEFKKSTRLRMHDQLREMARDIVNEERISNPGYRSRLWRPRDVRKVLSQRTGTREVQGISLAAEMSGYKEIDRCCDLYRSSVVWNEAEGTGSHVAWSVDSFAQMTELRLLLLEDACIEGQFSKLSRELVWLRWRYCPYDSIPSGFPLSNLRVLDVAGGKFSSLWQEPRHSAQLPLQLRELDLRLCLSLKKLPESIGMLKRLENLVLRGCQSLVSVPDEICDIQSLTHLDLSWCDKMESLPLRLGDLTNLRHLNLSFCLLLKTLVPSIGDLANLQYLNLKNCKRLEALPISVSLLPLKFLDMCACSSLEVQPDALRNFDGLEYLDALSCKRLTLPSPLASFQRSLTHLRISCTRITKLPEDFGGLTCLEELYIVGPLLTELPFSFGGLARLKILILSTCPRLSGLVPSIGKLRNLNGLFIKKCGLEYLPEEIGQLSNLENFSVVDCVKLRNLPISVSSLSKLVNLQLLGNPDLRILPGSFRGLSGLQTLDLNKCQLSYPCLVSVFECLFSLKKLGLHKLDISIDRIRGNSIPNLGSLSLYFCENIREFEIPSTLQSLEIVRCHQLKKVSMSPGPMKLQKLHLRHCSKLVEVSNLLKLSYLEKLDTTGCLKLHTINEGLENLKRLKELQIFITDRCLANGNEWWQKLISPPAVLSAIHLSARAIISNLRTVLSSFEQMKRVSSNDLKLEVPPPTKPVSAFLVCFVSSFSSGRYVKEALWDFQGEERDFSPNPVSLMLEDGANKVEIYEYSQMQTGEFVYFSIFRGDFWLCQSLNDGCAIVLSTSFKNTSVGCAMLNSTALNNNISEAWARIIFPGEEHQIAEICDDFFHKLAQQHEQLSHVASSSSSMAEVSSDQNGQQPKQELLHTFLSAASNLDLRTLFALDIVNCNIFRLSFLSNIPMHMEGIGPVWTKEQVLFDGVNRKQIMHLDLELSSSCRNIVEESTATFHRMYLSTGKGMLKIEDEVADTEEYDLSDNPIKVLRFLEARSEWYSLLKGINARRLKYLFYKNRITEALNEEKMQQLFEAFAEAASRMDLLAFHALDLINCTILLLSVLAGTPIKMEETHLRWTKRQLLFQGVYNDRLGYLDLELSSSCRNIVEESVVPNFQLVHIRTVATPKEAQDHKINKELFPNDQAFHKNPIQVVRLFQSRSEWSSFVNTMDEQRRRKLSQLESCSEVAPSTAPDLQQRLVDKFLRSAYEIDLRNIYALDIANCRIIRRSIIVHTPLIDEEIGFLWRKQQVLFEGVSLLMHLNVELSSSCLRLVEEASANFFLVRIKSTNQKDGKEYRVAHRVLTDEYFLMKKISSKMARLLRSRSIWLSMMRSMGPYIFLHRQSMM
eukprot:Gb_09751 [translate_table: standard]